jgi:tetratricopeptide (TPR) repeat protein
MPELSLDDAPQAVRDSFNKGFAAFERGNLDYAIHLLSDCVRREPRLLQARRFLRAAEVQKFKQKKGGLLTHLTALITGGPTYVRALALVKAGKSDEALALAEDLLRIDPLRVDFVRVFAQAAASANLPEAAIQTLEIAREHYPNDLRVLNWLGGLYQKVGRMRSARECFEKLSEISPNDPDALKALKDAMALDSMASDGWTTADTYRDVIKDTREAELLEQESKAAKSERDMDALIAEIRQKLEADPRNLNYYRALGRLHAQRAQFEEAVAVLEKGREHSPGDPEMDNAISAVRVQRLDHEIAALRAAGNEAAAEAKDGERNRFLFDNLRDRVQRYPNDLRLRYEWGVALYGRGMLNEAIQQFQLSQKNPRYRTKSLYYLAMCFKRKGQYDLAKEGLDRAAGEIATMDEMKKDIIYELGEVCDLMGKPDQAAAYYKQIYQVDIAYRDIAEKIERAYKR